MDSMFRRWVRLTTVIALLRPQRGDTVSIRLFTEDEATKAHYPWLNDPYSFTLKRSRIIQR